MGGGRDAAENRWEKIGRISVAGPLVLFGLLIFGLWAISFGTHRGLPRTAGPLPSAAEVARVETAAPPTAPVATAVASIATAPAPIVTKLPNPVPARRTYRPSTAVTRLSSRAT